MGKLLEFEAKITDVKQINPLFSTCKVRVLYTGKNRNLSIITKESVEKALPTLKNIPIVGEYSEEINDFKGHGGAIDLDSYKFIHTTKPYGVVPESATYSWEEVKGKDGVVREYLTIDGCYLWTGRYEEALSVIEEGKGQSMEIEVIDGEWDEKEEAYRIHNFIFSALCILGDDVEPAFEDASITASYSLNKDEFKREFSLMLSELRQSLSAEKEVNNLKLKELLKKYSLTVEDLTKKGINFNEISEDELEDKIVELFEVEKEEDKEDEAEEKEPENKEESETEVETTEEDEKGEEEDNKEDEGDKDEAPVEDEDKGEEKVDFEARVMELEKELKEANKTIEQLQKEIKDLREFKLNTERAEHENKVKKLFNDFQLTEEEVKDIDIHKFTLEEIEEKCYAILGKKLAKKNFNKEKGKKDESIHLKFNLGNKDEQDSDPYGDLFEKYNK